MLKSNKVIRRLSPGAPSTTLKGQQTSLAKVVAVSTLPVKYANLLYRLVKHFKPAEIIELGTSAGITTLYLAAANESAQIRTIEGNPDMAEVASELFKKSGNSHIHLYKGLFSTCLPDVLHGCSGPDFVFLDGDHRSVAVMEHLARIIPCMPEQGVLVIDDIYWSRDMAKAWSTIKQLDGVSVTIDLYRMGLVFFKKNQAKQHFVLRF